GVAPLARAARLARARGLRARLGTLGVSVPRVHAAGVRGVRREEHHRVLSGKALPLSARRRDRAARQARALGGLRSARPGRLAARVRVPDRRGGGRQARALMVAAVHAEQPDYFANHERARKFPWTLYHAPLERDLAHFLARAADEHPSGSVLVVGCGLLHEI